MGYANFEYPASAPRVVTAIVDNETGNVVTYQYVEDDDSWYQPTELDKFFATIDEAKEALTEEKQRLHGMMKGAKEYIVIMDNWRENREDDDKEFEFEENDYLPYRHLIKNTWEDRYEGYYDKAMKKLNYLCDYIRTGFLNVRGASFRKEDVKAIKWGNKKAALFFEDGENRVETSNETEFEIVTMLFGGNNSTYTYPSLNAKE